jgi:hypothetical protein
LALNLATARSPPKRLGWRPKSRGIALPHGRSRRMQSGFARPRYPSGHLAGEPTHEQRDPNGLESGVAEAGLRWAATASRSVGLVGAQTGVGLALALASTTLTSIGYLRERGVRGRAAVPLAAPSGAVGEGRGAGRCWLGGARHVASGRDS